MSAGLQPVTFDLSVIVLKKELPQESFILSIYDEILEYYWKVRYFKKIYNLNHTLEK